MFLRMSLVVLVSALAIVPLAAPAATIHVPSRPADDPGGS